MHAIRKRAHALTLPSNKEKRDVRTSRCRTVTRAHRGAFLYTLPLTREQSINVYSDARLRSALMCGMRTLAGRGYIRIACVRSGVSVITYTKHIKVARAVTLRVSEAILVAARGSIP